MYGMYGLGMMNPMLTMMAVNSNSAQQGNVHQTLKNKYGIGYEDFGHKPYAQGYPFGIIPPPVIYEPGVKGFVKRIFDKIYP